MFGMFVSFRHGSSPVTLERRIRSEKDQRNAEHTQEGHFEDAPSDFPWALRRRKKSGASSKDSLAFFCNNFAGCSFRAKTGLDAEKGVTLHPGGFAEAPAKMNHYAWTASEAIVQVHGQGPFVITYVNPADDPSTK